MREIQKNSNYGKELPELPAHIKGWVYAKASKFGYYDGARTKEEKQAFICALTKRLNERFGGETGSWDEARTGVQVRHLRKDRNGGEDAATLATPKSSDAAQWVATLPD